MAERPVFIPSSKPEHLVREVLVDFEWNPGFASQQKKKNVAALHESAKKKGLSPLLEVSTKADQPLGKRLSAFNLKIKTDIGEINLEVAYQGSKVFERGGPYKDIYEKNAKQDPRIKNSGALSGFDYFGQAWSLQPKTAFYDWLYLSALRPHQEFLTRLYSYKGFTDIEFNPKKSINCQAHACALLVSLLKSNLLDAALASKRDFIEKVSSGSIAKDCFTEPNQQELAM